MRATRAAAAALLVTAAACKERAPASDPAATGPGQRKLLGEGADYAVDPRRSEDIAADLAPSLAKRRAFGWSVAQRVLRLVPLSEAARDAAGGADLPEVPAWLTWYTAEEAQKIFELYYGNVKACAPSCDLERLAKEAIAAYSAQRDAEQPVQDFFERMVDAIKEGGDQAGATAAGLGKGDLSVSVTLYNNATIKHYLVNFDAVTKCAETPRDGAPATGAADVFGRCFGKDKPMPPDSVAVKSRWQRAVSGARIKAYKTDAAALANDLKTPKADWASAEREDLPLPPTLYKVRVQTGGATHEYALTGLHVTTKEVPEWVWVSLWWSKDPDADFGADRPQEAPFASGPWSHYKMCVTSTFKEEDPLFRDDTLPDGALGKVAAPLKTLYAANGGHSWCSNPYIEFGEKEVASNCVGCHQFAAPGVRFDRALPGGSVHNVRGKATNDFAADFLWSFAEVPDEIAARMLDTRQGLDGR